MIKAPENMNVYDFKRLILSDKKNAFFLDKNISNSETLKNLYGNSNTINISYDLNNWTSVIREFQGNNDKVCKLCKSMTVNDVIN